MSGLAGVAIGGIVKEAAGGALTRAKAVGTWLTGLNFWQLACIAFALFGAWQTVGRWSQHRHTVKVEGQLADATKVLADTRTAFDATVAGYRTAAAQAKADDAANATRVHGEQSTINQETSDAFQARLAAARAERDRLRAQLASAAHPGGGTGAPVPGLPAAAGGPAQAADQDGLSDALTATEQAIQLDELIKWVRKQAGVNVNGPAPTAQGNKP